MKTKFHLAKRTSSRYGSSAAAGGPAHIAALVDERYLGWLARQQQPALEGGVQRTAVPPVFSALARAAGIEGSLSRTYVFADSQPTQLLDDMVIRVVPQHAADGGLGLVRALGLELVQLASRGGVQAALVASDDERLIPYIDEAQWRGLKVVLVADESTQDFSKLMGDDPSWARLLMQADRRLTLTEGAWQALVHPETSTWAVAPSESALVTDAAPEADAFQEAPPDDEWRAQVQRVLEEWWQEESPHARLDLFEDMQNTLGVPPETDRHLLLRVRRALSRPLSFQEKKAMREMIRAMVTAQAPVVDEAVSS